MYYPVMLSVLPSCKLDPLILCHVYDVKKAKLNCLIGFQGKGKTDLN